MAAEVPLGLPFGRAEVEAYLETVVDVEPWPASPASVTEIAELVSGLLPEPGAVVLLALPSGSTLLRHFFGTLYGGAVPVLVAPATPAPRVREIAARLGASLVIAPHGRARPYGVPREHRGTEAARLPGPHHRHRPGEAVILTSGTSGISSGCLHRVSSLVRNAARHAAAVGLTSADTVLVNLPLNFSYALVAQALAALVTGARLVIDGPPFTPAGYHETIGRHGVTSSSLTPFLVRSLLSRDWSPPEGLRMLTVGGDFLDPGLVAGLLARMPGRELYLTYGLTEAGPRVSTLAAHAEPPGRHASAGRPLDGVTVSLRDVADGVGELLVASDTVLVRRVGVPEGRAADCFTGPGRIATGDLFRMDEDGYLYFEGRLTDFMVVNGSKVSLASVRRLAASLPGVVRAATRAYPGEGGEARFDLDLYVRDVSGEAVRQAKAGLLGQLLRAERPHRIRVLPCEETAHK
ncbi:class I adenylate-forming enzyme family protein [Streptosporangium sp. NPDC000396]|uniref:class I adenylate-forming enzyme family protein n=1 Tax=Streptosporangium sp. NPDC000396 TaxID=3366185 RepID=UPI0036AA55D9